MERRETIDKMPVKLTEHSTSIINTPLACNEHRLVDSGLFYYETSIAGYAERYGRGETSHTIHVWWARRPHAAMRMLVFATLCKDIGNEAFTIMTNLGSFERVENNTIRKAREMIKEHYEEPPRVLDMFAGGGTIPFEVANLGAQAYSMDSNELSVFIQKCNLVYSQGKWAEDFFIPSMIRESGKRVLHSLKKLTDNMFPFRDKYKKANNKQLFDVETEDVIPLGYVWSYSIKCPECKYKYFLTKRPWLSCKNGKKIGLKIINETGEQKTKIEQLPHSYKYISNWIGKSGKTKCPQCGYISNKVKLHDTVDELVAIIKPQKKTKGKDFLIPDEIDSAVPASEQLKALEEEIIKELEGKIPDATLPKWSGIVNPAIYGVETYADFINPRQRVVLLTLIKCLLDEYRYLMSVKPKNIAKYIIACLSSFIDQMVDWNCRLSMWIPQNEQVGRAFCGPGIAMLWDYVETDPVSKGPSNLWKKLERIIAGVRSIPKFVNVPIVRQGYAQNLPFEDNFFDAIVTDPPYYDNIYYNALADFFYSWKRILLKHLEPDLFDKEITDSKYELVASTFRHKTSMDAHEKYCQQLERVMAEAGRVLKKNGVLSFMYTHSSIKGWESLVRAFRGSSFIVTSVQPLSIERRHRPRGMTSEAINTCFVFVARKLPKTENGISMIDIKERVKDLCNGYASTLLNSGWNEADVALAIFAHGAEYLSNFSRINGEISISDSLKLIEQEVKDRFPKFKITNREPL